MSSDRTDPSVHPQSQADSGVFLLNSPGSRTLTDVSAWKHTLSVNGGLPRQIDRDDFTGTTAYHLTETHATPVVSAGEMQVVSLGQLSRSVTVADQTVTPTNAERIELDPSDSWARDKLCELLYRDLRRAIPTSKYDFRFTHKIVKTVPAFETGDFAGHHAFDATIFVLPDGTPLLHVEVSHTIRSRTNVADHYSPGESLPSLSVVHDTEVYSESARGELREWSDATYTSYVHGLGSTVEDHHDGILEDDIRQYHIEQDTQLVRVDYGDTTGHQLPHILKLSPAPETVEQLDRNFHHRFMQKKGMLPDERADLAREFVDDLSRLPTFDFSFEWGPTNHGFDHIDCTARGTLLFGDEATGTDPKNALTAHGVYGPPDECTIGLLCPARFDDISDQLPRVITESLRDIGSPGYVAGRPYNLGETASYADVWRDLPDKTDVALVVVPDESEADSYPGIDDPHGPLKRTLTRQGIPTQMLQKSTTQDILAARHQPLNRNNKLLNALSGLVAKAGGAPWQLQHVPGDADAFLGLDVSYDSDTGLHTGASASVVLEDGTTFAAESTTQQSGEKFKESDIRAFISDLTSDVGEMVGEDPSHIVALRDGIVNENTDLIRDGLSSLDATVDIVGVRKRGQPRVAAFDGTSFDIAEKGHAFVSPEMGSAIIHPFGEPELKAKHQTGTPRTLRLEKNGGPTDIETLAQQAYWLSEMHVGSPARSTRLPIPVHYAHKAAEYVREGHASPGEIIRGPTFI